MIIGVGHDLVDIKRIASATEGSMGKRFMERILTAEERELAAECRGARLHQFVAGRFAAKEAVVKAFGCGIGATIGFADIDIIRDSLGKPSCLLSEGAWHRLKLDSEQIRIHITITHERMLASAFAVVERKASM